MRVEIKIKVIVRLHTASQPIVLEASSTYQKGDLFCIRHYGGGTLKIPMHNIFSIEEVEITDG